MRRRGEDREVAFIERSRIMFELQADDTIAPKLDPAQAPFKANLRVAFLKKLERRIDKGARQAGGRDQRTAGAPPLGQSLADRRGGEPRRSVPRLGVQRGEQKGPPQTLVKSA